MDVVALAQHGVDYAVATLGTATTPVHVQKLFRLTDRVVFCFDGDNAGRKAAWRALENALPVLADGKNVAFLFLPDGEDPDDFVRQRGKAAFEQLVERATPLSEFLLAELSRGTRRVSAEGRAALVAAAKPLLAQIGAPVLAALLRRRLADADGPAGARVARRSWDRRQPRGRGPWPTDGDDAPAGRPGAPGARRPGGVRRRCCGNSSSACCSNLNSPERSPCPPPRTKPRKRRPCTPLIAYCRDCAHPLTTPAVMQAFADSGHERVLVDALAAATDQGLAEDQAKTALDEGVARLWEHAARSGRVEVAPATTPPRSPEESERLRQLAIVRAAARRPVGGGGSDDE